MKDPAFLFYPGDWLGGTMGMTFEEKGAYMELLMLQFNRDKFTETQAKLILNGSFNTTWIVLKDKFTTDGIFFWNERLRMEKEKRVKHCEHQRDNINKRWKKEEDGKYHGNTTVLPLENENENENINVIKEKKEELLRRKEEEFKTKVFRYDDNYGHEMLQDFCNYWTEHNEGGLKMRYEKEKVFDVARRLAIWDKRSKVAPKYTSSKFEPQISTKYLKPQNHGN